MNVRALPALALLGLAACFPGSLNGGAVGEVVPKVALEWLGPAPDPAARVQLLDFWATWCVPCKEAMPQLDALSRRYGPRGLAVVGVTDEERGTVEAFLRGAKVSYPIALDPKGALHTALGVKALPFTYLVSPAGKVLWRGQPDELTDAVLERVLAAP